MSQPPAPCLQDLVNMLVSMRPPVTTKTRLSEPAEISQNPLFHNAHPIFEAFFKYQETTLYSIRGETM